MEKLNVTFQKRAWRLGELATAYSLSIAFLRKEIRAGRLKHKKAGAAVLVLDEDFRHYLERDNTNEMQNDERTGLPAK